MLSTNYRNQVIDICCRMISTDGEVGLDERIWMSKLCEHNSQAKRRDELLGSKCDENVISIRQTQRTL